MKTYNEWRNKRIAIVLVVYVLIMLPGHILAGVEYNLSVTGLYASFMFFALCVFGITCAESTRDNYRDYRHYFEKDKKGE